MCWAFVIWSEAEYLAHHALSSLQTNLDLFAYAFLAVMTYFMLTQRNEFLPGPYTLWIGPDGYSLEYADRTRETFRWNDPKLRFTIVDLTRTSSATSGRAAPYQLERPNRWLPPGWTERTAALSTDAAIALLEGARTAGRNITGQPGGSWSELGVGSTYYYVRPRKPAD